MTEMRKISIPYNALSRHNEIMIMMLAIALPVWRTLLPFVLIKWRTLFCWLMVRQGNHCCFLFCGCCCFFSFFFEQGGVSAWTSIGYYYYIPVIVIVVIIIVVISVGRPRFEDCVTWLHLSSTCFSLQGLVSCLLCLHQLLFHFTVCLFCLIINKYEKEVIFWNI